MSQFKKSEKGNPSRNADIQGGKPGGLRLAFCLLLGAAFIAGCERAPVKPSEIKPDDTCFYCKSPIYDVTFAAEFVTKNGFVRKFDDLNCLIANARKVGRKNILAIYAVDAKSGKLFPAGQVQFVRSDKLRTPQNGGIVAFQDPAQADEFLSRFQAERIKLEDLLQ